MNALTIFSRTTAAVAFVWAMGFVGAAPTHAQHGHHHHGHHHHDYHHHGHYHGGYYGRPVVVVSPRPVYVAPPPPVHYHPSYHLDGLHWSPGRGLGIHGHFDLTPHYGW